MCVRAAYRFTTYLVEFDDELAKQLLGRSVSRMRDRRARGSLQGVALPPNLGTVRDGISACEVQTRPSSFD